MTARRLTLITTGLQANADSRTVSGMLLPYGEPGRTSLGLVTASAGALEVADRVVANIEHDPSLTVGRMVATEETPAGRTVTVAIREGARGDELLAEIAAGDRDAMSVEISDPVIRGGALVGGLIDGLGFVVRPAFPSARLAAAEDTGDEPDPEAAAAEVDEDPEGEPTETAEPAVQSDATTDPATGVTTITTTITPADLEPPVDTETTEPAPVAPASGSALATAANTGGRRLAAAAGPRGVTLTAASARLREAFDRTGGPGLIAALADITGTDVADTDREAWLGELWSGNDTPRIVVPLLTHFDITSRSARGWRWSVKPEVYDYAGDKAAITSDEVSITDVAFPIARLAGGNDIDRIIYDLPDDEFLAAYFQAMTASYAIKSDAKASAFVIASATAYLPGPVPTAVSPVAAAIVDGVIKVWSRTRTMPSFALVGLDAWRNYLLTREEDRLAFMSQAAGIDAGALSGLMANIIPVVGLDPSTVIVGARQAIRFGELPGTPIRVEALNIANGGVDVGVFGYYSTVLDNALGVAKVTLAAPATVDAGADFGLAVGADVQPQVFAVYADGSRIDVTDFVLWSSATPAKATVIPGGNGTHGLIHGVAAGTSVLTASYRGVTDTVTVTVA